MTAIEIPTAGIDVPDVIGVAREIGRRAEPFVDLHDRESSFVTEGYAAIRELGYAGSAVPEELGGWGFDVDTICAAQRVMGGFCASTALSIAMHQHSVLGMAWRWRQGADDAEGLLSRIADEQLILSSSGTLDPSNPSLTATPVDGGLLVSGRKAYSTGAPGADLLLVLAGDVTGEWVVNIAVPMSTGGVTIVDDWHAMGMRGSGTNSIVVDEVFVPAENTFGKRPRPAAVQVPGRIGGPGPGPGLGRRPRQPVGLRVPGLMIALAVIASGYLGIADRIYDLAIEAARNGRHPDDPITHRHVGELYAALLNAEGAYRLMIEDVDDDQLGSEELYRKVMMAKRQVVISGIAIAESAMEMLGSSSYFSGTPFERGLRDLRAAITHPLAPAATLSEIGKLIVRGD